jgi:deoxyribonuclease-4
MAVRVRQVLKNLTYKSLLRRNLIPDLVALFEQTPQVLISKRHPPFVYQSKDFSGFGVVMETVIQNGFRIHLKQPIIPSEEVKNLYDIATEAYMETQPEWDLKVFQKYVPNMINIVKELCAVWTSYPQLGGPIRYHMEYNYKELIGHPDVVTDQVVLDVKTTANFKSMAEETALQILAYYALIKRDNPDLKYVGVILPMQRTVAIYDVSSWDYQPYLDFLAEEARKIGAVDPLSDIIAQVMESTGVTNEMRWARQQEVYMQYSHILGTVGSHYKKGSNLPVSLMEVIERSPYCPIQMFISNPRSGKLSKSLIKQIPEASQLIASFNLQFFTHAPYVINLCANEQDADTKEYWQQKYLNENLMHTVSLGGKGVVVHTGASKGRSLEDSLNTMELMVRNAIPYATEDCPLLLETSAGEGSDCLTKLEELGAFFYRFTEEERRYLGVCVDTCHVFSSGYSPYEYLKIWEAQYKIRIGLIHFNDSVGVIGCCKDRHECVGVGKIGVPTMIAVAEWANQRKIPMVRE